MCLELKAGTVLYSGCNSKSAHAMKLKSLAIVDSPVVAARLVFTNKYYVISKLFQDKIGGFEFIAAPNGRPCSNMEIKRLLEDNGFEFIPTLTSGGIIYYSPRFENEFVTVTGSDVVKILVNKYSYKYDPVAVLRVYTDPHGRTLSFNEVNKGYLFCIKLKTDICLEQVDDEWKKHHSFDEVTNKLSTGDMHGYFRGARINCGLAGFHYYYQFLLSPFVLDQAEVESVPIEAPAFISPRSISYVNDVLAERGRSDVIENDNVAYLPTARPR